MDSVERIAQIQKAAIPGRLLKGAEILGRLWREGRRCDWSAICGCGSVENDFCRTKLKWYDLFLDAHFGCDFSKVSKLPWFLVEVMLVDGYWDATGLTAHVQVPGADRPIKVGPKGTGPDTIFELASIPEGPDRLSAVHAVAKIQGCGL